MSRSLEYLVNNGAMDKPGGVPTSHVKTGQQWDYYNAWPPLQHVVISSLEAVGEHMAAKQLATKWIYNNYRQEFSNLSIITQAYFPLFDTHFDSQG